MSFESKYRINPEFAELFKFNSEKEKLRHDAQVLMLRFFSEIERLSDSELQRKDFADAIKVSKSFITQVYKGDKLINFTTLAKLQEAFDITFHIEAKKNNEISYELPEAEENPQKKEIAKLLFLMDYPYRNINLKNAVGS